MDTRVQKIYKAIRPTPSTEKLRRRKSETLEELVYIVESDDFDTNPAKQARAVELRKILKQETISQWETRYLYEITKPNGEIEVVRTVPMVAKVTGRSLPGSHVKVRNGDTDFGDFTVVRKPNPDWQPKASRQNGKVVANGD